MPLCKQCSQLDFDAYRNGKNNAEDPSSSFGFDYWVEGFESLEDESDAEDDGERVNDESLLQYNRKLAKVGLNSDEICELCVLIARHIEKNGVGAEETVDIRRVTFCSTTNRISYRLSVIAKPETVDNFCGPVEAHMIPQSDQKRARTIVQLQECSTTMPSTATTEFKSEVSLPGVPHSRRSGRLMSPKADLGLFRDWIHRCRIMHKEKCGHSIWPEDVHQRLLGFLLIDVEKMNIVDAPADCRYVTLSYCWGTVPVLRHLISNSVALRKEGALTNASVPATVTDAIQLAKGVGEKYLWVDALCIIQDDLARKKQQLAQMGLIYSMAAFTIVAASGDSANAGLPGIRDGTRSLDQDILRIGKKIFLSAIDGRDYYGGVKDSTWMTRAWTIQEKLLSKKLLIFTDAQVYWKCWNALWLEETVLENVPKISFFLPIASAGPTDIGFASLVDGSENVWDLYELLVNAYMARQLSFKADILNAFSGLCQALTAIRKETFHWGMPVSNFDSALGWRLRAGGERNHACCDLVKDNSAVSSTKFPSWSWAAWHGETRGWVSWADSESLKIKDPRRIIFYCQDSDGKLHRVMKNAHSQTDAKTEETMGTNDDWMLPQNAIEETSLKGPVNIGFLHFWTSTARLHVDRTPSDSANYGFKYNIIMSKTTFRHDGAVFLDSVHHLEFKETNIGSELPEGVVHESAANQLSEIVAIDFIVVARLSDGDRICTLAVEWKDGVAYRFGICTIKESIWTALRNREWKLITLG